MTAAAPATRLGLHTFDLHDLAPYAHRKPLPVGPLDHWLFYVGVDDVHGILHYLHSRFNEVGKGNMFGWDDEQLNDDIVGAANLPHVLVKWSLDARQAGGVHEAKILAADFQANPAGFRTWFKIMNSSTGQITHTKGGVLDNTVGYEGSTNWSASGEGIFVPYATQAGGKGYQAQNNTLMVFTDRPTIDSFTAELDAEHSSGRPVVPKFDQPATAPA